MRYRRHRNSRHTWYQTACHAAIPRPKPRVDPKRDIRYYTGSTVSSKIPSKAIMTYGDRLIARPFPATLPSLRLSNIKLSTPLRASASAKAAPPASYQIGFRMWQTACPVKAQSSPSPNPAIRTRAGFSIAASLDMIPKPQWGRHCKRSKNV